MTFDKHNSYLYQIDKYDIYHIEYEKLINMTFMYKISMQDHEKLINKHDISWTYKRYIKS